MTDKEPRCENCRHSIKCIAAGSDRFKVFRCMLAARNRFHIGPIVGKYDCCEDYERKG